MHGDPTGTWEPPALFDRACDSCGATKAITDFPFDGKGGGRRPHEKRRTTCRSCWADTYQRAYYSANRERIVRGNVARDKASPELARARRARWWASNHERVLAERSQWRRDNPELAREADLEHRRRYGAKKLIRDRAYYAANKDRIRETTREYNRKNRKVITERVRAWAKANPERRRKISSDYAARRRLQVEAGLPFTHEQLAARMACCGNRCWVCFGDWDAIDHVKPLARGGPHMLANLRPICRSCNSTKHAAWPMAAVMQLLEERFALRQTAEEAA